MTIPGARNTRMHTVKLIEDVYWKRAMNQQLSNQDNKIKMYLRCEVVIK